MYAKSAIADYETLLTDIQIGLVEASASAQAHFEELDLATLLLSASIAYFNLGAEHEHCKDYRQAESAYERSLMYAMKAPPEVAQQMVSEAARSMREVGDKEEKVLAMRGLRMMQRLDAKNLYHIMRNGELQLS
jgi:hypothetical protein